jgi:hypothetical protein
LSCQNAKAPVKKGDKPIYRPEDQQAPNYKVEPPTGWEIYDTVIEDQKCRYILPPASLDYEKPIITIVAAAMHGRQIDDYMTRNMDELKATMEGVTLLEKDTINISSFSARWFTYTLEDNGDAREMIVYTIPVRGFAYVISCGTNKGIMKKYRSQFDQVARSFSL